MPARSAITYLRWMLASLVAGILGVAAINILIDPLAVLGSPRIPGLNAIKPYLDHHQELTRWRLARRDCANAGIFGNSRAEIGLDPEHPAFAQHGLHAFNHAIPGTYAGTSLRQLDWLTSAGCMPQVLILGVEFFDFLGGRSPRPLTVSAPAPAIDAHFLAESVFSLNGLSDSIRTVALQHARNPAMLTERGFNPLRNYVDEVAQSGHYTLFRQRSEENLRRWQNAAPRLQPEAGGPSEDEQLVGAILDRAGGAGSTVHLLIYPYHAEIRLMLEQLGLGHLFDDWKRSIVALAEAPRNGSGRVVVWDFSGIGEETLEAIPEKGDKTTQMTYFWEAGHFKKALGDRMIARIMGAPEALGEELHSTHLDAWLAKDRQKLIELLQRSSPLRNEVEDLLGRRSGSRG